MCSITQVNSTAKQSVGWGGGGVASLLNNVYHGDLKNLPCVYTSFFSIVRIQCKDVIKEDPQRWPQDSQIVVKI